MSVLWGRVKARLLFLGIGLGIGILISAIVGYSYSTRIEELEIIRKEQIAEKVTRIQTLESKYSKLETEHKKIKSHVHITEKTNTDGSTERVYDSKKSVESERTVVEQQVTIQKLNFERRVDLIKHEYEKRRLEESRPTANLSLGIDSQLVKFIHVNYNISGPWTVGLLGTEEGTYGISLGVSL